MRELVVGYTGRVGEGGTCAEDDGEEEDGVEDLVGHDDRGGVLEVECVCRVQSGVEWLSSAGAVLRAAMTATALAATIA